MGKNIVNKHMRPCVIVLTREVRIVHTRKIYIILFSIFLYFGI